MFPKVAQLKTVAEFRSRLAELGIDLPVDEQILTAQQGSPLATPGKLAGRVVGNRWCIHPMEGWDGTPEGFPAEPMLRRWRRFGESGAKLIWGGEAAAIRPDGRANPHQLLATPAHQAGLEQLLAALRETHAGQFGAPATDDLVVGLQLTHSGRFSRPDAGPPKPRLAFRHPLLDPKFGITDTQARLWTDEELEALADDYVAAAQTAHAAGFDFVDVKACHGYLLHELLGAHTRPGRFGGDLDGRCRLLRTVIERIRREVPSLAIGVRLSLFDVVPYTSADGEGRPMEVREALPYRFGFGVAAERPDTMDLSEPLELVSRMALWGVDVLNVTAGSPYYSPHIQRPAIFPPSDGYRPPEDPLVGVVRQIQAVRAVRQVVPQMPLVGSGYSYLQDFLPQVAQAVVRAGWVDWVGLGRMVLSYPRLPADALEHGQLARKQICRTFSDCTTAPRAGLVSGCYPLDPYYKNRPEAAELRAIKQRDHGEQPPPPDEQAPVPDR